MWYNYLNKLILQLGGMLLPPIHAIHSIPVDAFPSCLPRRMLLPHSPPSLHPFKGLFLGNTFPRTFQAMMASLVTIDIRGLSLTIQAMACGRMLTSMSMNGCMQISSPLKYVIMILRRAALLSLFSLFISMRYTIVHQTRRVHTNKIISQIRVHDA